MEKSNISKIKPAGGMVIFEMAFVLITHLVRPVLNTDQPKLNFFFGILPNFGAAMALPFLFTQIIPFVVPIKYYCLPGLSFTTSVVLSFAVLSIWEAVQFLVWAYPIDPYDILASGLGVFIAFVVHQIFVRVPAQHQ